MGTPDSSFRRRLLIDSLTVLAADVQTQVAWLVRHGVMADEIALDFDHAVRMADGLVEDEQLDRGVLPDLREIDAVLTAMGEADNADQWRSKALSADEGWGRARQLARRVLVAELGDWQRPLPEITIIR
ncbi:hypothetical protein [Streptomyces sp. NPDC093094]|uniref:hypothetical protein n=1 Tax=Streptomyces sp. NPDC093094 TaxID=3366026 RepID=UPI00380CFFB6